MTVRKIVCSDCNTVYKVEESRIPNKLIRSTCKKCGSIIVINEDLAEEGKRDAVVKNTSEEPAVVQERKSESNNEKKNATPLTVGKGAIFAQLVATRDKVQDYFKDDDDEITGFKKLVYILLKVLATLLLCNIIIAFLGIFLPSIVSHSIGVSLFVLVLNWKTIVDLTTSSAWQDILFKEKWAQLTVPFLLANLYVVVSQIYDLHILPIIFAILILALFLMLPFYINYNLAVSNEKSIPLTMLLTLLFSWIVTLFLAFMANEEDEA